MKLVAPWPTCGTGCAPLSWDFAAVQLYAGASVWVATLALGLCLRTVSRCFKIEGFKEWLSDTVFDMQASFMFGWLRISVAAIQFVLFCLRAQSGTVNGTELMVEAVSCAVYLLFFIPRWATKFLASSTKGAKFMFYGAMDCFLIPSVICMAMVEVNGARSWGSLSFLAMLHVRQAHMLRDKRKNLGSTSLSVVVVSFLAVGFTSGMAVLVLERLGDPAAFECCNKDKWNAVSAIYFMVSTITTVGPGDLVPATSVGRICTTAMIFGGLCMVALSLHRVNMVFENSVKGLGSYRFRRKRRHVVVTGNPDTQMALDLIAEMYHEDHCPESDDLDVVFLLPMPAANEVNTTLKALTEHRNQLPEFLANRIFIFQGSVMNDLDMERVCAKEASAFFVLPKPLSDDPQREDTENIIRTKTIQHKSPLARVILVLNKAEHEDGLQDQSAALRGSQIATIKNTMLLTIAFDEFKLGVAAKEAQIPGFIPLITNWCKCIADSPQAVGASPWQVEYERGLAKELYEVVLSKGYFTSKAVFAEIVLDVLDRSDGEVYLIGIIEAQHSGVIGGTTSKKILINPDPGYLIQDSGAGSTLGIFVAPNRESIIQLSEDGKTGFGGMARMTTLGRSMSVFVKKRRMKAQKSLVLARKTTQGEDSGANEQMLADLGDEDNPLTWAPSKRLAAFFKKGRATKATSAGRDTRTTRMTTTLGRSTSRTTSVESGSTTRTTSWRPTLAGGRSTLVAGRSTKRMQSTVGRLERSKSKALLSRDQARNNEVFFRQPDYVPHPDDKDEQEQIVEEVKRDTADWAGKIHPMLLAFLNEEHKENVSDLVGFARRQLHSEVPQRPPPEVLAQGGHVLFLCAGAEGLPSLRLGVEHFVKPLRRHVPNSAKPIPIVILAPLPPNDWNMVNSYPDVYFLEGTPSSQFDLDRACARTASHIFVSQVGIVGGTGMQSWTIDSEVICVARLLDAQLPHTGEVKVVVDVHSDTSYHFMMMGSRNGVLKRRMSALDRALQAAASNASGSRNLRGDGQMDQDYYRSELFAGGRMFVGTALTSLAVNTFYNPSLHELVMTMLTCQICTVSVPKNWIGRSYRDLIDRLLWGENLLPIALFRRQNRDVPGPSFMYAAPCANDTELDLEDVIVCFGQKPPNA